MGEPSRIRAALDAHPALAEKYGPQFEDVLAEVSCVTADVQLLKDLRGLHDAAMSAHYALRAAEHDRALAYWDLASAKADAATSAAIRDSHVREAAKLAEFGQKIDAVVADLKRAEDGLPFKFRATRPDLAKLSTAQFLDVVQEEGQALEAERNRLKQEADQRAGELLKAMHLASATACQERIDLLERGLAHSGERVAKLERGLERGLDVRRIDPPVRPDFEAGARYIEEQSRAVLARLEALDVAVAADAAAIKSDSARARDTFPWSARPGR